MSLIMYNSVPLLRNHFRLISSGAVYNKCFYSNFLLIKTSLKHFKIKEFFLNEILINL